MLPVYSIVSFLSYLFYTHDIYFEVIRDCYEAFAIASFFTLLCNYIAPNLHEQKDYFRQLTPINWFWSVFGLQKCTGGQDKGILRRPKSGLTWFNVCSGLIRVRGPSTDIGTGRLDRCLPILLHSRLLHHCLGHFAGLWSLL